MNMIIILYVFSLLYNHDNVFVFVHVYYHDYNDFIQPLV